MDCRKIVLYIFSTDIYEFYSVGVIGNSIQRDILQTEPLIFLPCEIPIEATRRITIPSTQYF